MCLATRFSWWMLKDKLCEQLCRGNTEFDNKTGTDVTAAHQLVDTVCHKQYSVNLNQKKPYISTDYVKDVCP